MTQVVVQDFELEGIPQATPGAAEHPVHKLAPQQTKGGFDLLPRLTEDETECRGSVTSNQQHVGLFRQVRGTLGTAIAQITQGDTSIYGLDQGQGGGAIIVIPRRQDNIEDSSVNVAEQMELEPKEPPLTALPKIRALVPQQPDPPMVDRLAEGDGFTINQIQSGGLARLSTSGGQQPADLRQQVMHPRQPLFIGGQMGKGRAPVLHHQPIRLFERGDFKRNRTPGENAIGQ